jgi:glucose/arabinose dehydrogenase
MARVRRAGCIGAWGLAALLWASPAAAAVLGLERVASGLDLPMFATHAPGDRNRLFIAERRGVIRILHLPTLSLDPVPFLTISDADASGDGGLQSLAFHPDFETNGRFFVYVTVDNGGLMIDGLVSPFSSHIREYTVSVGDPDVADPTPREIHSWAQPLHNHNGGWIGFDPAGAGQGLLYVMSGDGGKQFDPDDNAQTLVDDPLGKVLRLDVDGDDFPGDPDRNYAVPSSNPFVGQTGDDETWAYGLRNPFRASFDRETGDLWIADVGQDAAEEIDFQMASSPGGENYAWSRREGLEPLGGGALLPGDVQPIYDYGHGTGPLEGASVVGGYVYRGPDASLRGLYLFGDTISAKVWTFEPADPFGTVTGINAQLTPDIGTLDTPVSFGEDADGNLYIVDYAAQQGELFRIVADVTPPRNLPTLGRGALAVLVLLLAIASRAGKEEEQGS